MNVSRILLFMVANSFLKKLLANCLKFYPFNLTKLLFLDNLLNITRLYLSFLVPTINNLSVKTINFLILLMVDKLLFNFGLKWLKYLKILRKNIPKNNLKNKILSTILISILTILISIIFKVKTMKKMKVLQSQKL